MRCEFDGGAGQGARLGLIVLSTDESLEHELGQIAGGRVNLLHSRIPAIPEVTPETLRVMAGHMTAVAGLLPQGLSAVGYGCTSGSVMIGDDEVARLIRAAHPDVAVTNPMQAVIGGLEALGVRRIALVSPYLPSVTEPMRAHMATHGIEVIHEISFGEGDDRRVARISEASTRAAMLEAGRVAGVEAVFSSCTNLRSLSVIDEVEQALGLPVISSNQALGWDLMRSAGQDPRGWGPGRLFQL
ncbi:Asp/Glu racemase [Roseovarius sp. C7]|uniref:maleate cis-trans isomerase family protein n=1 Tax=Roseovarius sp. C7 TaxID=3398643 RepID=UPI0039F556DE